jgi:hypothetical protein
VSPLFARYIGIDYSGAATAETPLKGLQVFMAEGGGGAPPRAVAPPDGGRAWTRRGVAAWLGERLAEDAPTLAGVDHSFSLPEAWFARHGVGRDWDALLADFAAHWPTDETGVSVEAVRRGLAGAGAARSGESRWRRLAEVRAGAKSNFHFGAPGSVAKSTHAGLPWLARLRAADRAGARRVHVWPFDGWRAAAGRHVLLEAYPALYSGEFAPEGRGADAHDAFSIAAWTAREDAAGRLAGRLEPALAPAERALAAYEGWVLGVGLEPIRRRRSSRPERSAPSR